MNSLLSLLRSLAGPAFVPVLALALLTACGGSKDPDAKLAQLKKEQATTQAEIAALEAKKAAANPNAAAAKAVPVKVMQVRAETFRSYLEVQGRAEFDENSNVAARSAGTITSLRVQRGDKVKKGQLLATTDAAVIDANIAEVRVRVNLAKVLYEKQAQLWNEEIGTQVQYLQTKNDYAALRANLQTLERQRDLYNVTAPFAGTVDEVPIKVGEAVSPGTVVARLVSGTGGKILADVSENYANTLKAGDLALVTIPDLGEQNLPATVRSVSRSISTVSRTFTVELRLTDKAARQLRPNMVATVRILSYEQPNATVLPVDLVQRDGENSYVYTVTRQNGQPVATKQVVKTGRTYDGEVEINKGLKAGDQVVSAGYQSLTAGQVVAL